MIYLVYHDPGSDDSRLRLLVEGVGGVSLVRMSRLGEVGLGPGDTVALLMPMRGGHADEVRSLAASRGASWAGTIPTDVTAEAIARAATRLGCSSVRLYYWPAKRLRELQEEDLREIASRASSLGVKAVLEGCADCIATMALLPGRISLEAEAVARDCRARSLGALVEFAADSIVEWVKALAARAGQELQASDHIEGRVA